MHLHEVLILKSIEKDVTITKKEKQASAFKRMLDKATDYAKVKAGTAVLGITLATAAPAFVSCEGNTDLSQYEPQDTVEVPDADNSAYCTKNTTAYYKAMVTISGEEHTLKENDSVRINGRDYRVYFTQEGSIMFRDRVGNEIVIDQSGEVNNAQVEITDRSVDLAVYSSRMLVKLSDGTSEELAIMPSNSTVSRSINGALIDVELGEIESWDVMGNFAPVSIKFSLDGQELGTAGTLTTDNSLATGSEKRTVTVSAKEFLNEQFPEEGVTACQETRVLARIMIDGSDEIHTLNEGEDITLSNNSPIKVEKVFPGLTEGAVVIEVSWREKGEQKYATLMPGQEATVTNNNGESTATFVSASFETEN